MCLCFKVFRCNTSKQTSELMISLKADCHIVTCVQVESKGSLWTIKDWLTNFFPPPFNQTFELSKQPQWKVLSKQMYSEKASAKRSFLQGYTVLSVLRKPFFCLSAKALRAINIPIQKAVKEKAKCVTKTFPKVPYLAVSIPASKVCPKDTRTWYKEEFS